MKVGSVRTRGAPLRRDDEPALHSQQIYLAQVNLISGVEA
jgi:hypothetical protein